jgi:hypothetical protein
MRSGCRRTRESPLAGHKTGHKSRAARGAGCILVCCTLRWKAISGEAMVENCLNNKPAIQHLSGGGGQALRVPVHDPSMAWARSKQHCAFWHAPSAAMHERPHFTCCPTCMYCTMVCTFSMVPVRAVGVLVTSANSVYAPGAIMPAWMVSKTYYYLLPLCTSRSRSHGLSRHLWRFLCKCYHYQHWEQPAASSPPLTGGGRTGSTHSQLQLGLPITCPPAGR